MTTYTPTALDVIADDQPLVMGLASNLAVTVTHTTDGSREVHYFGGGPQNVRNWDITDIPYGSWVEGKEYRNEYYDTGGTTLLRTIENTWAQRVCEPGELCNPSPLQANAVIDPRIIAEVTRVRGSILAPPVPPGTPSTSGAIASAGQTFGYDRYNNRTDVCEFGYGAASVACPPVGVPAGLLRRTSTTFKTTAEPGKVAYDVVGNCPGELCESSTSHIRDLVSERTVYAEDGTIAAHTRYTYDASGYLNSNGYNCQGYVAPSDTINRGNSTAVARDVLSPAGTITTYQYFDQVGNVVQRRDGRGKLTVYSYADNFSTTTTLSAGMAGCAFVSQVTLPIAAHQETTAYDYYLGLPTQLRVRTSMTNPSALMTTSLDYGSNQTDRLDRLSSIVEAVGDAAERRTLYVYDNTINANNIVIQKDLYSSGDKLLKSQIIYDGLGRKVEARTYEDANDSTKYITTATSYDGRNRITAVSLPYRPGSNICNRTYAYEGLGRTRTITGCGATYQFSYDLSAVSMSFGPATYTLVTSQITELGIPNVVTTRGMDALGRLGQVGQTPLGQTEITNYRYDALDNLMGVDQSGRQRSFLYDGLGRLRSAQNPETGNAAISYAYDENGNLLTGTDPRFTKYYVYDDLNRLTVKSYSDPNTKPVTYTWDTVRLGRLSSVDNSSSKRSYDGYDGLGRVTQSTQATPSGGTPYSFRNYTYYKNGVLSGVQYPSGRNLTYGVDGAGRSNSVSGYVSAVTYAPQGAIAQMTMGNGSVQQICYNIFLQPAVIRVGTAFSASCADAGSDPLNIAYTYDNPNSGNILRIETWRSGTQWSQTFAYDGSRRLISGTEGGAWNQGYLFDKYGNRAVSGTIPIPAWTPDDVSQFDAHNQWIRGSGDQYDTSGNQKGIAAGKDAQTSGVVQSVFTYDAENRMLTANVGNTGTVTYVYDGDGRRVQKVVGAAVTTYIYDAMGQLAAESGPPDVARRDYVFADHLGSTRLVQRSDGSSRCYDYLPFGEYLYQGTGGRGSCFPAGPPQPMPSPPDGESVKFTGKERDAETGLDYFGARYFSGAQGRFTSPDQPFNDQDPMNPQSWNLYSYVMNNPLRYTDPDGEAHTDDNGYYVGDKNGECQTIGGGTLCWSAKNNQWEAPPPPPPIITMSDLNPLDGGPPLAFQGFVNLFLNGQGKRGGAQLALGILPSALVSFGAARMGGQQLFQGFQAAEDAALAAKGLSASTAFNAGKGVINGETTGMTNHALSQALARGVTKQEIAEALTHVAKSTGGSVLKFIGQGAEVRVNQITGKIVTVIRFSSATAK